MTATDDRQWYRSKDGGPWEPIEVNPRSPIVAMRLPQGQVYDDGYGNRYRWTVRDGGTVTPDTDDLLVLVDRLIAGPPDSEARWWVKTYVAPLRAEVARLQAETSNLAAGLDDFLQTDMASARFKENVRLAAEVARLQADNERLRVYIDAKDLMQAFAASPTPTEGDMEAAVAGDAIAQGADVHEAAAAVDAWRKRHGSPTEPT